jgi:hypothetical protein
MLRAVDAVAAISEEPIRDASCWPIDLRCRDGAGDEIVVRVKPINRRQLAGVAISEAVSWSVISACGLHVAEPLIVSMSAQFAADLTAQGLYDPPIREGRHWGTRFLQGVGLDEGFTRSQLDQVGQPEHIFRIFLIDELTGNADRLTEGNLLLVTDPVLPPRLIAIDQSNCFGGPDCICDNNCLVTNRARRYAKPYQVMEQLLLERPPEFVDEELRLIEAQRGAILAAVNTPHAEWYDGAGITPDYLAEYLTARLDGLDDLTRRDHWRGICELGQANKGKLKL